MESTYRSFLAHVDGWENFQHGAALLDVEALLDPSTEQSVVQYLQECEVEPEELEADAVMPITTEWESALMLAGRSGSAMAGQVVWRSSGGEVERYPTFAEYFAARTEHEEQDLEEAGHPRVAERTGRAEHPDPSRSDEQVRIARTMVADPRASWAMSSVVRCLSAVKAVLADRGLGPVWGLPAQAAGAREDEIEAVLTLYGLDRLDTFHDELLRAVNGWEHVLLSWTLLSTAQLQDASVMRPAVLRARAVLDANGLDPVAYQAVAVSTDTDDVLVVGEGERVLWLRDQDEVITYPQLHRWLLVVVEHHLDKLDATVPSERLG